MKTSRAAGVQREEGAAKGEPAQSQLQDPGEEAGAEGEAGGGGGGGGGGGIGGVAGPFRASKRKETNRL